MKGLFIPGITAEMFRNGCLESVEALMAEGEIYDIDYSPWIPVSDRLPEGEGWYLTSLGDKTYGGADVDMYCKGWVKYGTHVLAWMPLPEPYEPTN